MEEHDQIERMKENAKAVQTLVADMESLHDAFLYAIEVTKGQGGSTIAAPGLNEADQSTFSNLCKDKGITLLTKDLRGQIGTMHTGFTKVDWGIAETATLVLDSRSEDMRLATMLSETHVAVLSKSRIRPDAMALENQLTELMRSPQSYLAFISGASRTADIERALAIGVHGPQELHILFLNA